MDGLRDSEPSPSTWTCGVLDYVAYICPTSGLSGLREPISRHFGTALSTGLLKQLDEQTLVALAALATFHTRPRTETQDYASWGLISSPRAPGRQRIAESIHKFRQQGAWSVSPHIIPHCSLHSQSGTLSQALRLHGPNLGIGGMPGCEAEALWGALGWLNGECVPGVFVVLTGWSSESLSPDRNCQALLLALSREVGSTHRATITFGNTQPSRDLPQFGLEAILANIDRPGRAAYRIGSGILEWQSVSAYSVEAA